MIKDIEIGIANFKPFGEKIQRFKLKPITLVFGPNSIGKSSVVHSIAYMQSIFKNQDFNPSELTFGDKISIGGFSHFVHKKDTDKEIILEYKFDTDAIPLNASIINRLRTLLNSSRAEKIKKAEEKEALKAKLLSCDNEKIKKDLLLDARDFKTDGFNINITEETIIDFFEMLDYLKEWDKIPDEEKKEGWQDQPKEDLQNYLNDVPEEISKFFQSISPLYIFDPEDNDNKWVIFNHSLFADKLFEANDKTIDAIVEDIKKKLQKKWNAEPIDWDIPEIFDDSIKIKSKIGFFDENTVQDIQVQYYVGEELLLEANRIKNPETEKKEDTKSQMMGIDKILNDFSIASGIKPTIPETYNPSIFDIKLFSNHWLVQFAIQAIEEDGGWDKSEGTSSNINIHSYVQDVIHYNFKDVQNKSSILFDYASKDIIDTKPLFNWTPECENSTEPVTSLLEKDFSEYMESRTYDSEFDEWESYYWEDDRITKNSNLYEFLTKNKNEFNSINDILMFLIYDWVQNINNTMRDDGKHLFYVGPLRSFPERHEFSFPEKQEGSENSKSVWQRIQDNDEVKEKLNQWLGSEKLKTPYELQIQKYIQSNDLTIEQMKEIFQQNPDNISTILENNIPHIIEMSFHDKRYNTQVNIREMGLGVSQVLPILVNLFQKKETLIAIEQPELHLHPAVQSDLADELIKSYKNNSNSLLIETHSEHLLLRLMKRMRQTSEGTLENEELTLTPDDISLLYVDADKDKTYILELELAEDGSLLDPWPGGFFEEGFRERFL